MLRKLSWILGVLVGGLLLGWTTPVQAEKNHFTVTPELPKNQVDKENFYFDLKMKPEQEQTIYVNIHNGDTQAHTYDVVTNLATTSNNGMINYDAVSEKPDKSLPFNIAEATTNTRKVKVKANSTKRVGITIEMPKKSFDGVALGGVNVHQHIKKKAKSESGVTASTQNQFGYTIGLQLREQDKLTVKPDMKLLYAGPKNLNGYNHIVAQLQNPRAAIMRDLKVSSYVTKSGSSKKLLKTTREGMKMAPNSNFYYALGDGEQQLKPGKYTLYLQADSEEGKYQWEFKKDFTISGAKARQLNNLAINKPVKVTNWWLVGGLAAVILALLGWIIWLLRKRRKED